MTEPRAVAPPPRSGSKSVAEFPHRGRAPSSGSPGTGEAGQAAGWGTLSAQASAAGTWPATAQPRGRPREPGWGCILGPLAQRSRRLPGTDSSPHSGHTNKIGHQLEHPHSSHAQHPMPHLRPPARHVTPRQPSVTPSVHTRIPHMSLDFTTHSVHFTPRTPRAGKFCLSRRLHSTRSLPRTRTSLHTPAPFLQLRGRPLSLPCKQATSSPGPAEERPLVPVRAGGAATAGGPTLQPCPTRWPGEGQASVCGAPLQRLSPVPTPSALYS